MQTTAASLVGLLTTVDALMASSLTNDQKTIILDDMLKGIPPEQFCIHCLRTRAIIINKIQEAIDGFKATQSTGKKPVQSRARKTPAKGTKK